VLYRLDSICDTLTFGVKSSTLSFAFGLKLITSPAEGDGRLCFRRRR